MGLVRKTPPRHMTIGDRFGRDADVVDVSMRCNACHAIQTEPVDMRELGSACSGVTCLFCGRAGAMRMVNR